MLKSKNFVCLVVAGLLLHGFRSAPLYAQEKLSSVAQKAQSIVEAAHAYISENSEDMDAVQKALEKDPRFRDDEKELYIFMHRYDIEKKEAVCCGQGIRPELLGKNMWQLRTPTGRLLFYEIAELVEKEGKGWLEYEWLNPYKRKIQIKVSYVMKIVLKNGQKAWVGCGFWKE
ncbi:MAG: cache domain-containing protein [Desulfobacterales bacterium]